MIAYPCEAQYGNASVYQIIVVDLIAGRFQWKHHIGTTGLWYMDEPSTNDWHLTNEL